MDFYGKCPECGHVFVVSELAMIASPAYAEMCPSCLVPAEVHRDSSREGIMFHLERDTEVHMGLW